jgi:hypothetical protein
MECRNCPSIVCTQNKNGRFIYNEAMDEGKFINETIAQCSKLKAIAALGFAEALRRTAFTHSLDEHRGVDPD